jgi:hypothetical protein
VPVLASDAILGEQPSGFMRRLRFMTRGFDSVAFGGASPAALADDIKAFARLHGGATASIEYLGKRGVRIALTGGDRVIGEMDAPSTDSARVACEQAGVSVDNSWDRELADLTRPEKDLWRSSLRRVMRR